MEGKFSCQICAEFFDSESDLQNHVTSVHGQESQKAQCPKCDRVFSKKSNLKAHIENIHRERASNFICYSCQKPFSNSSSLRRHLASPLYSGVDKLSEAKRQRLAASNSSSANVR